MPVMPVMSLSNLSPGCFPTRLSFALTGIASAVGTQGGKGLDLKGAKAGTAKLQLAATGCNSKRLQLVGVGSRASGNHQNQPDSSVFCIFLLLVDLLVSDLGPEAAGHGGKLVSRKFEWQST